MKMRTRTVPPNRTAAAAATTTTTLLLLVLLMLADFPTMCDAAAALPPSDPKYYDLLRTDPDGMGVTGTKIDDTGVSNVVEFTVGVSDLNGDGGEGAGGEETYYLADLTSLLPYTNLSRMASRAGVRDDAAALLMAIYHFNNGLTPAIIAGAGGSTDSLPRPIAEAYASCRVRLTTELHDTGYSPIQCTRTLTAVLDRDHSAEEPLPAAVLGAYRSAVTSPTAILTGVNSIPQVSYHSSSMDFNSKEQYPLFGRTAPSSVSDARALVAYLAKLGVDYVGVIFVTDSFGSSFQKSLQDAAGTVSPPIRTESASFSYQRVTADGQNDEIANAISSLRATRFRYFVALISEDYYDQVMEEAARQGLVGKGGYHWIFVGGIGREEWQRRARFEKGSALAEATDGIAVIQKEGGSTTDTVFPPSGPSLPAAVGPNPSTSTYDRFRQAWYEAMSDPQMVDYFRSKEPVLSLEDGENEDKIESIPEPRQNSYFIWDAVQSVGFAMCMASQSPTNSGGPFISGADIFANFTNDVTFEGASGTVVINKETGTREPIGVTYTVWNARARTVEGEEESVVFDLVPTAHYVQKEEDPNDGIDGPATTWNDVPGQPFLYFGGTTTQPATLPPPSVNMNYVGTPGRIVGYVLMGIVMALSVVSVAWTGWQRDTKVVSASQPLFLIIISVGCLVMSSTIVPLSMEETTAGEDGLNKACMAAPWLFVLGFVFAFAALFTKTWTTSKIYHNPDSNNIVARPLDLFKTLAGLLLVNVALLLSWNLVSPLKWVRVDMNSKDSFNRTTEKYATCYSDKALSFVVVIIAINLGALIFANWQAYKARDAQTEYQESRYVAISMASILQAWCMGIPIMIVVWETPQAKFFVAVGIVFVTCTAVLLLIFVPKVLSVRSDRRMKEEEARRKSRRKVNARAGRGHDDDDDDGDDEPNPQAGTGESEDAPAAGAAGEGNSDATEGQPLSKDGSDGEAVFADEAQRRQSSEKWIENTTGRQARGDIEGGEAAAGADNTRGDGGVGLRFIHSPGAE